MSRYKYPWWGVNTGTVAPLQNRPQTRRYYNTFTPAEAAARLIPADTMAKMWWRLETLNLQVSVSATAAGKSASLSSSLVFSVSGDPHLPPLNDFIPPAGRRTVTVSPGSNLSNNDNLGFGDSASVTIFPETFRRALSRLVECREGTFLSSTGVDRWLYLTSVGSCARAEFVSLDADYIAAEGSPLRRGISFSFDSLDSSVGAGKVRAAGVSVPDFELSFAHKPILADMQTPTLTGAGSSSFQIRTSGTIYTTSYDLSCTLAVNSVSFYPLATPS